MFARLLMAVALSAGTPSDSAVPTDEVVEALGDAIVLLERELELLPAADPQRAGEEGYDSARRELGDVQRAGAIALAELRYHDVPLSPAIVSALDGAPPDAAGGPRRPPPLETYATAIADLRRIVDERAASAPPPPVASPSPDGLGQRAVVVFVASVIVAMAAMIALGAVLVRRHRNRLSLAMEEALTDPLTKLANRRRLDRDVGELVGDGDDRVAVLMVDVDHFKRINDHHGHAAGDVVLQQVAALISMQIRSTDVVYRYGGEEFCVLLPGASVAEAHVIAERIRSCVGHVDVPPRGAGARPITVSIGLAEDCAASTRLAIVDADDALLRAKHGGRDRTVIAAGAAP